MPVSTIDVVLDEYCDRVRRAILNDTIISGFVDGRVVVVADRNLDRMKLAALMGKEHADRMILIHDPEIDPMHEGTHGGGPGGRDCSLLSCLVSPVVKFMLGLDEDLREKAIVGTDGKPGVIEMQEHIFQLFWNRPGLDRPNGLLNLLPDSAGVPYLWDLKIGASKPEYIEEEKAVYLSASTKLEAHKWREF